ncbi:FRG domain-containing protein [Streptococcus acidominimus]|uniref:FRG domain n=2 Tax=Streptococcus acidominimus TaxID=1326 RepID=A0A380IDY3_STRAI|nr:FRG domain-containing protein [Streptococcus acidominimus]MBF0847238.1 FRG domain-containing protein [Streptococcus danieliae]MBF0818310.1 FRG domain-containing protein [Streptococcus acidominimus]MBF0838831.1 FRG domain-containing protein [Streptococcus acidominimus]MBF0839537.1 FRG domain-containing protein [Streptococcus acidominimus]TFU31432.1 FRG domain-containing protein [Streptococcus acidominimus]
MHNSNDDFYNKVNKEYDASKYFEEVIIKIRYIVRRKTEEEKDYRFYKILNLEIESENSEIADELKEFIKDCNKKLKSENMYNGGDWQLFYLYKELIQFFTSDSFQDSCNYFRGQSHEYPLLPGILRKNVQNDYRQRFEYLYKRVANEFPEKISYFPLDTDNMGDREEQLALLQHYGLKTSLLDITKNPYIALLFMLSGLSHINQKCSPSLFFFKIDDEKHREKHLFTEVKKDRINERIIAQKGAFLNFDKIDSIKSYDIKKIKTYKIVLEYDEHFHKKSLREDIKRIEELLSMTQTNYTELGEYKQELEKKLSNSDYEILECLRHICEELIKKLKEYHYFKEDLFPDFERKIQYLAQHYEATTRKTLGLDN